MALKFQGPAVFDLSHHKILFVFPDCALKTRHWDETKKALIEMVDAAQEMRATVETPVN